MSDTLKWCQQAVNMAQQLEHTPEASPSHVPPGTVRAMETMYSALEFAFAGWEGDKERADRAKRRAEELESVLRMAKDKRSQDYWFHQALERAAAAERRAEEAEAALRDIEAAVNHQAEDEGLWFEAATAPEAYLQQGLRLLYSFIEDRTGETASRPSTTEEP